MKNNINKIKSNGLELSHSAKNKKCPIQKETQPENKPAVGSSDLLGDGQISYITYRHVKINGVPSVIEQPQVVVLSREYSHS